MYCTTDKNYTFVHEDDGRLLRKIGVNGKVESAYMNGTDIEIWYNSAIKGWPLKGKEKNSER